MVISPPLPVLIYLGRAQTLRGRFRTGFVAAQLHQCNSWCKPVVANLQLMNRSLRIRLRNQQRCLGKTVNCTGGSKAHGNNTRTTLPVPTAAIILSPPPIDTGMFSGKPNSLATRGSSDPIGCSRVQYWKTFRKISHWIDRLQHFPDHWRVKMLRKPVPEHLLLPCRFHRLGIG